MLPHHPGKCSRMHGHSYRVEVAVSGTLAASGPSTGMVIDFDELSAVVRGEVIDALDHTTLNDLMANPTAEEIALWIWRTLAPSLSGLDEIVVWETQTACAVVRSGDS